MVTTTLKQELEKVSLEGEVWKQVDGYDNYLVSNKGRVWSLYRNNFIALRNDKDGYKIFHCFVSNMGTTMRVHRFVAMAFLPNPDNLPIVEHLDCNPSNNCVENLKWSTTLANNNHPITLQRLSKSLKGRPISHNAMVSICKSVIQISLDGTILRTWPSGNEASRILKINFSKIAACARRERSSAGGYIWRRTIDDAEWIKKGEKIKVNIRGRFGRPLQIRPSAVQLTLF